jgi:hypothetical protein
LGQHTAAVLTTLASVTEDELAELQACEVVFGTEAINRKSLASPTVLK